MKITKRQLRRIIKEEVAKLKEYGGRPYDPTVPGSYQRYRDNPTGDVPPEDEFVSVERDAIDMLNDILDDWDKDPKMSTGDKYYNRIVGVTKLLER